ncbi:amino acid adenylation domain-containing protein [Phyllobacterium sp. K27]
MKIRGHRIELGEIQAALLAHPDVREAAVLAIDDHDGGKRLAAYVVAAGSEEQEPSAEDLRAHLADRLPAYMVPSAVVFLDAMPLTVNGKLDRRALPEPETALITERVAPRNETEARLLAVWKAVLKRDDIGVTDNFFMLGGDSILSLQIIARARAAGLKLTPKQVFEAPRIDLLATVAEEAFDPIQLYTPEEQAEGTRFPLAGLSQPQLELLNLPLDDVQDIYPATPVQQGLIFHSMLQGEGVYIYQLRLGLSGDLDRDALRNAWASAIARHDILRTHFEWRHGGEALQVVHRSVPLPYAEHDWSAETAASYEEKLAAWRADDLARGFDLAEAPLMRVNLFARPDGGHDLIWTNHHVLTDGWGTAQLMGEIIQDYGARREGRTADLPSPAPYRDYLAWLRRQPSPEAWWRAQIERLDEPATLTQSLGRPRHPEPGVHHRRTVIDADLAERLRQAAQTHQVTLNTLMQGAWAILLSRYGNRPQVAFGATVSGRPAELPGVERMLGLFINSLPVFVDVPGAASVGPWLRDLQARNTELRAYEHTPLADLQQWTGRTGDALFDTLVVFENYPVDQHLVRGDGAFAVKDLVEHTHYPLALRILPDPEMEIEWSWDGEKIGGDVIERIDAEFRSVLRELSRPDDADFQIATLQEPPLADREFRTREFQALIPRIGSQADAHPEAEAVSCEGERISYGELDGWSNRIGRRLKKLGIMPEERVGLAVERSIGLVAGLLGTLKAGGAFVSLDPTYPADRLRHMIVDAGVSKIICDPATAGTLGDLLSGLDVVLVSEVDAESAEGWEEPVHPDQLAYVIYTSGSTGMPKGVAISHHALSLHLDDFLDTYRIGPEDKVLQSSTINFDVALHELLPALTQGGQVLMRGPQLWDLATLTRKLAEEKVTFSRIPTAYWQQWLHDLPEEMPALRQVTVGGEGLPGDALKRWQEGPLSHIHLDNLYGPTETTIACLYRRTEASDGDDVTVNIGVPYPSRSAFVMDRDGNEAPVGGLGELCIGGETLARGYVGKPGLTAERFVPDPTRPGGRLYRSGDLVRQRPDGVVDFLGRLDNQIKLRGFRIELGEIEAALRAAPGVRDAVAVIAGEGEHRHILAYAAGEADADDLRSRLEQALPGYMVPSSVMVLDALPLMPNGKIDRKALPEPDGQSERTIVAPRNETEARLLAVWKAVLKRDDIGVTDNFFMLGGDSILSLQIIARARAAGLKLTPKQVFEAPRIDLLATVAEEAFDPIQLYTPEEQAEGTRFPLAGLSQPQLELLNLPLDDVQDIYPATPVQQGLIFHSMLQGEGVYIYQLRLGLSGDLDRDALRNAWASAIARHDILRTHFEWRHGGEALQVVHRSVPLPYAEHDWSAETAASYEEKLAAWRADDLARGFDLAEAPLMRVNLFARPDGGHDLVWTNHHVLTDGWGTAQLMGEIIQDYGARREGRTADLPAPVPYRDYLAWLRRQPSPEAWWRAQIERLDEPATLTQSLGRPRHPEPGVHHRRTVIDADLAERLRQAAQTHQVTLNTLMQGAWAILLSRYGNRPQVAFGATVSGRPAELPGVERMLGLFINSLPIFVDVPGDASVGPWLRDLQARNTELRAYEHTPLADLQQWTGRTGDALFDTLVVFENYPVDQELRKADTGLATTARRHSREDTLSAHRHRRSWRRRRDQMVLGRPTPRRRYSRADRHGLRRDPDLPRWRIGCRRAAPHGPAKGGGAICAARRSSVPGGDRPHHGAGCASSASRGAHLRGRADQLRRTRRLVEPDRSTSEGARHRVGRAGRACR